MPLPVIADTYRVALEWTGPGGLRAVNVLHLTAAASDPAGVWSDLDASVTASMWNHTTSAVAVTRVVITKLDGSTASFIAAPTGAKWAGSTAAGDLEVAPSAIVSLRTALRGPRNRGRLYLPFPAEANVANGLLNSAVVTGMNTAWSTFRVAIATAGSPMTVASYVGATATAVLTATAESQLATQRRRQDQLR